MNSTSANAYEATMRTQFDAGMSDTKEMCASAVL